jgi:hypothetical protein
MAPTEVFGEVSGDAYRIKASELNAEARQEPNAARRTELENLAMAYLRLADQAERNALNEMCGMPSPQRAVQQQQQQQLQAKTDDDPEQKS